MKKVISIILAMLLLVAMFTGCSGNSSNTDNAQGNSGSTADGAATTEKEKFVIGFSNKADAHEWAKQCRDYFEQLVAEDDSLEVIFTDADWDSQTQLNQIDTLLLQGIDLLIMLPNDSDSLVPGIEKCNEAGVPVILFGTGTNGGEYTYVGISEYDSGYRQGKYLAEHLEENAKVLYLAGTTIYSLSLERKQGFIDGLSSRTDVEILSALECDYTKEDAMRITEDWIITYPEFDAIGCCSDLVASGAYEALVAARRDEGVMLCGLDGETYALEMIKEGTMSMTVLQDKVPYMDKLMSVAKKIQAGEELESDYFEVELVTVTADNVDDYLN